MGMRSVGRWEAQGKPELADFKLVDEEPDEAWQKGKLSYFDEEKKERYIPYVIEPSAGADRATLAFLIDAYDEDVAPSSGGSEARVVLRLHPKLAPYKAALLPLVRKDGMAERADKIYRDLKRRWNVFYDDAAAIGKRYRRQDEIGTPWCFTVDGESAGSGTVTIRDRDQMTQERIAEDQIAAYLSARLDG